MSSALRRSAVVSGPALNCTNCSGPIGYRLSNWPVVDIGRMSQNVDGVTRSHHGHVTNRDIGRCSEHSDCQSVMAGMCLAVCCRKA